MPSAAHETVPALDEALRGDARAEDHFDVADGTVSPSAVTRRAWLRRYQLKLFGIDLFVASLSSVLASFLRFGDNAVGRSTYLVFVLALPIAWVAIAALNRAYDSAFVGNGAEEFQRIYWTFIHLVAAISIVSYAFKADFARGFVLVALPLTLALDLGGRYAVRKQMHRGRTRGIGLSAVVVVGTPSRVADLTRAMQRDLSAGMNVVGACLPDDNPVDADALAELTALGVSVLGSIDDIQQIVRLIGAGTVAVTSSAEIGPEKLRWISWQLEDTEADLIVAPGLIEVAGTRINVRPVAGLPLLHVEAPRYSGPHRLLKGAFDRITAGTALLLLAPVLFGIAMVVRVTSRGPAFFKQTRVGRNGETFTMVKFRSMYIDAEARLAELTHLNENADGLLFKMRDDPRVTKVGKVLRRFSIDELPQLINVLTGTMSLVGPRPPLPREVAQYGDDVRRRLLVRPGLTGLWQVSGRSDLSWEESVRLDLRYVENWSLAMDMLVLWKTLRAVVGSDGAY